MIFWFKSTAGGIQGIYCKRNIALSTNAGIDVSINSGEVDQYNAADFDVANYQQAATNNSVILILGDGTNTVTVDKSTAVNMFDGNWHSVGVFAEDDPEYLDPDYSTTNYFTTGGQTAEIYLDKVSLGTSSIASITSSTSNTRDCIFGGRDNAGVIENKLIGSIAYWFFEGDTLTPTEITNYHDSAIMIADDQKNAIMFVGDESASTNDKIK